MPSTCQDFRDVHFNTFAPRFIPLLSIFYTGFSKGKHASLCSQSSSASSHATSPSFSPTPSKSSPYASNPRSINSPTALSTHPKTSLSSAAPSPASGSLVDSRNPCLPATKWFSPRRTRISTTHLTSRGIRCFGAMSRRPLSRIKVYLRRRLRGSLSRSRKK